MKPPAPNFRLVAVAALVVAVTTTASRLAAFSGDAYSLFWPAAGIGFVLIYVWGLRGLLALALGMTGWASFAYRATPALIPFAVAASCVGPYITAQAMGPRFRGVQEPFGVTQSLFGFLRTEALLGVPAGALLGCLGMALALHVPLRELPMVFVSYWIIELCGAVTFAPVVFALFGASGGPDFAGMRMEIAKAIRRDRAALVGIAVIAGLGVASIHLGEPDYARALLYLLLPLLALNAARTQPFAGQFTVLVAAVAVLTTRAYALRMGNPTPDAVAVDLMVSALYLVVSACTALVLSAISGERRRAMERLEEQAFVDPLTGLFSEAGLRRSLVRAAQSKRAVIGLVSVRLINEQAIEQLLGGQVVLEVVRRAGGALDTLLAAPTWGRVGSGRFVGIVTSVGHLDPLLAAAQAIVADASSRDATAACRPMWAVAGVRAQTSDNLSAEALLAALRGAEDESHVDERAHVVDVDLDSAYEHHLQTREAERVREAISAHRVVLYAQAIVENAPGGRHSLELLVKLRAADGGLIDAPDWLPLAMRHGLMPALDATVIQSTFEWFAAHRHTLAAFDHCGINLSGSSVGDPDLVRRIQTALNTHQLPPDKFMFEVTEGQNIASPARAAETLRALRALGCRIAIDDFGTGLATFDYLKRFEIDCVKIDGSFIRGLANSAVDEAIVSSIVTVARAVRARTVAEYVASPAILQIVTRLGVDASQGWAVGLPLPLDVYFEEMSKAGLPAGVAALKLPRRVGQTA